MKGKYNINGIGEINYHFYSNADKLLQDKRYEIIERTKNVSQLGSIKIVYNGANYNRFEYLLLQISLVNMLKENTNIGLGSNYSNEFEYSGAEILQFLFIFSNMGHLKDTFTANKVFLHLLKNNIGKLGSSFKRGISKSGSKTLYKSVVESGNYHKMQWINALFLLSRNKEYTKLTELIKIVIDENEDKKFNIIFQRVREIAYISMDLNYSIMPIDFKLHQLLYNNEIFVDEILKEKSALFSILDRLNILLQETLYMENNSLIVSTQRGIELYNEILKFLEIENPEEKVSIEIIDKLITDQQKSPFFSDSLMNNANIPWNKNKNLSITYHVEDESIFPNDIFQNEFEIQSKLGKNIFFGSNYSPDRRVYREVYAIDSTKETVDNVKKVIYLACRNHLKYKGGSAAKNNNGNLNAVFAKKIITYFFRHLLVEDYYCDFDYKEVGFSQSPFIICSGVKAAMILIEKYLSEFKKLHSEEEESKGIIFEMEATKSLLSSINYKGLVVVYLGSLRFLNKEKNSECEIDGFVLFPHIKENYSYIIEAKGTVKKKRRFNIASKQQTDKLIPLIDNSINSEINEICNYGSTLKLL